MTTKAKTEKFTLIAMERRRVEMSDTGANNKVHVAGGNHTGIIINKQMTNGAGWYFQKEELSLHCILIFNHFTLIFPRCGPHPTAVIFGVQSFLDQCHNAETHVGKSTIAILVQK
jgi:hypothetical protein